MNTSSTTSCPAWCVTTPEDHAEDDPDSLLHTGPTFGRITIWLLRGEFSWALWPSHSDTSNQTIQELHELAQDVAQTRAWIEAHQ